MEQHKCEAKCFKDWAHYACSKTAKYHENGKWWCGTHAPSKVKERADKSREKWNKRREADRREREEQDKRERRRDACESALANVPDPEAAVKAAREALKENLRMLHAYVGPLPLTDDDWTEEHGIMATTEAALALLNGTN